MGVRSVIPFLILVVLLQATRSFKIPLRVQQLKRNLDVRLNENDDSPSPVHFKDAALVVDVLVDDKPYSMALDSLSSLFWLPSTDCQSTFCKNVKDPIHVTLKNDTFEDDKMHGYKISASLQIGDCENDEVTLLAADYVDADLVKRLPSGVDGVFGLMNKEDILNTLPRMASLLAIYINKWQPKKSGIYLGELPEDVTKVGANNPNWKPQFISSDSEHYWKTSLNYISNTDGPWNVWSVGGADILLDTTYSGIAGPAKEVESINKFLGTDDDGYIDCFKIHYLQPLAFHIRGIQYKLDPKYYIRKGDNNFDVRCKSVFEPHNSAKNIWKLGVAFMQQYLTVMDYATDKVLISFVEVK